MERALPRGAVKVTDTRDGVQVIITPERNLQLIRALFAVSFVLVVLSVVVGVFSLAFLGLAPAAWAVWKAYNQELILIERRALSVRTEALGIGFDRRYEMTHDQTLCVGRDGRGIACSDAPKEVLFGDALRRQEATALLDEVTERLPQTRVRQGV